MMYMVKEDMDLNVLERVQKFIKGEPYAWSTFVKAYPEHFVKYIEPSGIIVEVFDFGNEAVKFDNVNTKMLNTEMEEGNNE